jgi:hypothetical protein
MQDKNLREAQEQQKHAGCGNVLLPIAHKGWQGRCHRHE